MSGEGSVRTSARAASGTGRLRVEQERLTPAVSRRKSAGIRPTGLRRSGPRPPQHVRHRRPARDQLVRLDSDVGRRNLTAPDLSPASTGPAIARPAQHAVRFLHLAQGDQPAHIRAVQLLSVQRELGDIDFVPVAPQPRGAPARCRPKAKSNPTTTVELPSPAPEGRQTPAASGMKALDRSG